METTETHCVKVMFLADDNNYTDNCIYNNEDIKKGLVTLAPVPIAPWGLLELTEG